MIGRIWAKKGTQPYVYTRSQHHHRLNIFGCVDPVNGRHGIMKWINGNTFGFLEMLNQIIHRFTGKIIDLRVDNAHWHRGKLIDSFLVEHSHLHIHYLPPYHPELNCQERLWRMMRYKETTNTYFETMVDLDKAIFKRSQRWKPKKIKSICQLI